MEQDQRVRIGAYSQALLGLQGDGAATCLTSSHSAHIATERIKLRSSAGGLGACRKLARNDGLLYTSHSPLGYGPAAWWFAAWTEAGSIDYRGCAWWGLKYSTANGRFTARK